MDQTLMHRIRERAYHIWMETGGNPDQNWLQAETEILQMETSESCPDKPAKKPARKTSRKREAVAVFG
jgi:Protein of unknown function (DUF2934)